MRGNVSKLVPGAVGSSRRRHGSVLAAVVLLSACSSGGGSDTSSSSTAAPASSPGSAVSSAPVGTAESSQAAPSSAAVPSDAGASGAASGGSSADAAPVTAAPPAESAEPVNPAGTTAAQSAGGPCDEFVDPGTVPTFVPDAGPAEDFTGGDVVQRCTWASGSGASLKVELRDALAAGLTGLQGAYLDTPITELPNAAAGSTLSQPAGEDPTASIQVYSTTADSAYLLELTWKAPGANPGALVPLAKAVLGL